MGGQSAFGTKAGDLFTKITIGVASFWIMLSVLTAMCAPIPVGGDHIDAESGCNAQQNPAPSRRASGKPADDRPPAKPAEQAGRTRSGKPAEQARPTGPAADTAPRHGAASRRRAGPSRRGAGTTCTLAARFARRVRGELLAAFASQGTCHARVRILVRRIVDVLLSMTGFGEAHGQQDGLAVAVEVRAINSRFFKLTVRATEGYASLEPHIEEIARQSIRRGTVQVNLRVDRLRSCQDFRINSDVLSGYRDQLQALYRKWDAERHGIAGGLAAPARRGERSVDDPLQSRGRLAGDFQGFAGGAAEPVADADSRRPGHGRRPVGQLPRHCRRRGRDPAAVAAGPGCLSHAIGRTVEQGRSRNTR